MESLEIAGGRRGYLVERTNTKDLTTVDPVIQEPDAGVISDSMKAHPHKLEDAEEIRDGRI